MAKTAYKPFFTIGYEGLTPERLLALLQRSGVSRLVDVRAVPLSRKKGFSKNVLKNFLDAHGIVYTHLRSLGTPAEGREAVRKNQLALFRRIFDTHMNSIEAQQGLSEAIALTATDTICLLCYEADPGHCHRSIVADRIAAETHQKFTPLRDTMDL